MRGNGMSADGSIRIDMAEYGMNGIVTVREPRLTRRRMAENAIGRISGIGVNKEIDLSKTSAGDVQTIVTLMFVDSAPFPLDLEDLSGFYAYCDRMDDACRGSAERFWKDLSAAAEHIMEGENDPLEVFAPASQTGSSA